MVSLRGFLLPQDTGMILRTFFLCARYAYLVKVRSVESILDDLERAENKTDRPASAKEEDLARLAKARKAADFFLRRLMGYRTPCLPRALVLYRWCVSNAIAAEIAIGVRKDEGILKGHAWIILQGRPFMEDEAEIWRYRIMLSRSNLQRGMP